MSIVDTRIPAQARYQEECRANPGRHPFVVISERGTDAECEVVRWCPICGCITVDLDYDGRTNRGQVMKLRAPEITRHDRVAFGGKGRSAFR